MNTVLTAIDTLSARHMSCYGYERNTTPFVDEYAEMQCYLSHYRRGLMRELYDLQSDPHEMQNIAEECPNVAGELEDALEGWIAEMMVKNRLTEDPLVANGLTLGARWVEWVKKHGYW